MFLAEEFKKIRFYYRPRSRRFKDLIRLRVIVLQNIFSNNFYWLYIYFDSNQVHKLFICINRAMQLFLHLVSFVSSTRILIANFDFDNNTK